MQKIYQSLMALVISSFSCAQTPPAAARTYLSFNGNTEYVSISNANFNSTINSSNAITLEGWFKLSKQPVKGTETALITEKYKGVYNPSIRFSLYFDGQNISAGFFSSSIGWLKASHNITLDTGVWTHIAASYNLGVINLYISGEKVASFQCPLNRLNQPLTLPIGTQDWIIGKRWEGGGFFSGQIAEVRIWNVARTQGEINKSMHKEIIANVSGLVANYRFEESTVGVILLDANNSNHGELIGFSNYLASWVYLGHLSTEDFFQHEYGNSNIAGNPSLRLHQGRYLNFRNVYRENDNNIIDIFYQEDGCILETNLTDVAGAPKSMGNPSMVDNLSEAAVVYRDVNNNISDIYWSNNTWAYANLNTTLPSAPLPGGDPCIIPYGNYTHLVYKDENCQISNMFYNGTTWEYHNLSQIAIGAPLANGDPTILQFYNGKGAHVVYRDENNKIADIYWNGITWVYKNLSNTANGAPLAKGNPSIANYEISRNANTMDKVKSLLSGNIDAITTVKHSHTHIIYRDINDQIADIYYIRPSQFHQSEWSYVNLSSTNNAPPADGDPYIAQYNDNMHIVYRDINKEISDIYLDDRSWPYVNLSKTTNAPIAIGDPIMIQYGPQLNII